MHLVRVFSLLLVVIALFPPLTAWGSDCSMLSISVDEARSKLQRAANETSLDDAKDQARRAKNALEDAALAAQNCKCNAAYGEFDSAATYARRARDSDDAETFAFHLNRAIRSFNAAIEALRTCALTKEETEEKN